MKTPVHIAVTGAAGQISYSLLFRLAAGSLLGPDQPIVLHLLNCLDLSVSIIWSQDFFTVPTNTVSNRLLSRRSLFSRSMTSDVAVVNAFDPPLLLDTDQ